jgi:hypothetical protein
MHCATRVVVVRNEHIVSRSSAARAHAPVLLQHDPTVSVEQARHARILATWSA